jgi:hypothetical protein
MLSPDGRTLATIGYDNVARLGQGRLAIDGWLFSLSTANVRPNNDDE